MKYSQILKANSSLTSSLGNKEYNIIILSNIIISQLNETVSTCAVTAH